MRRYQKVGGNFRWLQPNGYDNEGKAGCRSNMAEISGGEINFFQGTALQAKDLLRGSRRNDYIKLVEK